MGERPGRLRPLLLSRVADQGSLALASLAMALALEPAAYVQVAVALIVASCSVQLSDFGLGFAIMSRGRRRLRRATAERVRRANLALAVAAAAAGAVIWAVGGSLDAAALVAYGGLVWAATGEAFMRRSAALTDDLVSTVARAEVLASAVLVAGTVAAALSARVDVLGVALVLRYVTEAWLLPSWQRGVTDDGEPLGAPLEWVSQAVTFAAANVDYAVVAVVFGGKALAVYTLAFRTASGAFALLANPLTQRALVDLGQAGPDQPEELDRQLRTVLRRQALAGAAAAVVAVVVAPLVSWALDASWDQTLALTIVLAAALPARLLVGPAIALGLAVRRRWLVIWVECGRGILVLGTGALVGALDGSLRELTVALTAATVVGALGASAIVQRAAGRPVGYRLLQPAWVGAAVAAAGWLAISP